MFGIEEEFFIESSPNGDCPSLRQMDLVFAKLADRQGWQILHLPNTGCTWESPYGTVGVWNDFSTNILEIAYPVLDRPAQFIELRDRVLKFWAKHSNQLTWPFLRAPLGFGGLRKSSCAPPPRLSIRFVWKRTSIESPMVETSSAPTSTPTSVRLRFLSPCRNRNGPRLWPACTSMSI